MKIIFLFLLSQFCFYFSHAQEYSEPVIIEELSASEKKLQQSMAKIQSCSSFEDFDFCFYPGSGQNANNLVYFFHGIMGYENIWIHNKTYLQIQSEWQALPKGRPAVVSISYGRVALLTPKNSHKYSGALDPWNLDRIENFEKKHLKLYTQKRFLMGTSMGGHNALNLYIKMFPNFSKIGLLCPAQLLNSPYDSKEIVEKILPQVESLWPMYLGAMGLMRIYYDQPSWNTYSPFNIEIERLKKLSHIRILLVKEDLYGFTVVNKRWIELLDNLGASAKFKISDGIHCFPKETRFLSDYFLE